MDRFALLARALRRHPLIGALFLGAAALALALGLSLVLAPSAPPGAIQGWMTPGYVVRAYGVERAALAALLDAAPGDLRGLTLAQIAQGSGRPEAELIAEIEALRVAAQMGAGE